MPTIGEAFRPGSGEEPIGFLHGDRGSAGRHQGPGPLGVLLAALGTDRHVSTSPGPGRGSSAGSMFRRSGGSGPGHLASRSTGAAREMGLDAARRSVQSCRRASGRGSQAERPWSGGGVRTRSEEFSSFLKEIGGVVGTRIARFLGRHILAVVAIFLALGGTAYAGFVVSSNSQIGPNTVSGHNPPAGKHSNLFV